MIYILHFSKPFKHARHYVGYALNEDTLYNRIVNEHAKGCGGRLVKVILDAGLTFQVSRIMEGDQARERQIKNGHTTAKYCPVCRKSKNKEFALLKNRINDDLNKLWQSQPNQHPAAQPNGITVLPY